MFCVLLHGLFAVTLFFVFSRDISSLFFIYEFEYPIWYFCHSSNAWILYLTQMSISRQNGTKCKAFPRQGNSDMHERITFVILELLRNEQCYSWIERYPYCQVNIEILLKLSTQIYNKMYALLSNINLVTCLEVMTTLLTRTYKMRYLFYPFLQNWNLL